MINVGLIGLGPYWEERYRPVLERFRSRIRICAVYDSVASRAQTVAHELDAHHVLGITSLLARSDVRAVLLLDNAWQGPEPFRMILDQKKSAYLAGSLGEDVESIARRHLVGLSEGLTLMPEFSRRYTPATSRLQELIATEIGPPARIQVTTTLPQGHSHSNVPGQSTPRDFLVGLIDWCRHILRLLPSSVQMTASGPEPGAERHCGLSTAAPERGANLPARPPSLSLDRMQALAQHLHPHQSLRSFVSKDGLDSLIRMNWPGQPTMKTMWNRSARNAARWKSCWIISAGAWSAG